MSEEEMKLDKEKRELLRMSEIGIWLDHYDDIFSDFDSRPYSQRALSDDFLLEAKKASRDKVSGEIELRFLIHKDMRNSQHEILIRKRLREHFKKHHDQVKKQIKQRQTKGLMMAVVGCLMITLGAYLLYLQTQQFLINFLETMLSAAGWFTGWTGLDHFFSNESQQDLEFYEKMSNAEIIFSSF